MNTKKYLSGQWKFVKPLSIRAKVNLIDFQAACFALEEFLAEKGLHLKKFQFYADDYNSYLSLDLDLEDYEILMNERFKFYGFLHKNLPVNHRELDWFNDFHLQESLSFIVQCNELNVTGLHLVLNRRQYEVEFPSHDFFVMSQELNKED